MLTVLHRDESGNEYVYPADRVFLRTEEDRSLLYGKPGVHVLKFAGDEHVFIPFMDARTKGKVAPEVFVMNAAGKTVARHNLFR